MEESSQLPLDPLLVGTSSSALSSPPPEMTPLHNSENENNQQTEHDDDLEIYAFGDTIQPPTYRTRQKLQAVTDCLRKVQWSFPQFINAWANESSEIKHRRYRTREMRRKALKQTLQGMSKVTGEYVLTSVTRVETDELIKQPYFGKFDYTTQLNNLDFNIAFQTVQNTAPRLHTFLCSLLMNRRAHQASYSGTHSSQEFRKRLFTIVSMICHSRYAQNSNYLSSILDAYLLGSGTKRQVVETLAGLGLCHSYAHGNRLMKQIADREKVRKGSQMISDASQRLC